MEEIRKKKIAGQMNYIVGGNYFNDNKKAKEFVASKSHAIKKVLEKHGEKEKDVYGLAKHRKMFDSPEHKKAVAHGKAKQAYEDSHSI